VGGSRREKSGGSGQWRGVGGGVGGNVDVGCNWRSQGGALAVGGAGREEKRGVGCVKLGGGGGLEEGPFAKGGEGGGAAAMMGKAVLDDDEVEGFSFRPVEKAT